jgi:hypothetical protein
MQGEHASHKGPDLGIEPAGNLYKVRLIGMDYNSW